MDSCDVLKILL